MGETDKDVEIIEEVIVEDVKSETEDISKKQNKFFEKVKEKKESYSENYKSFSENYEKSDDTIKKLSDKISWDIIKILIYFYILTFVISDLQYFLFVVIFALLLLKLDVVDFVISFIRSLFKK